MSDLSEALQARVAEAIAQKTPVSIEGSGSKAFYGRPPEGTPLPVAGHRGVINYAPTELMITARCGTPLSEIEALLAEHGQMLPFEPPHFGPKATLGGAVAVGLSGPRRPWSGAVRDFVLGIRCINGKGEILHFGGEVVKNVAGFDASRLMTGALGTLGVILDVSLKTLPRPRAERTLAFAMDAARAIEQLNRWCASPLPLSAACHDGERLCIRLSGAPAAVEAAARRLGGEHLPDGEHHWAEVREHRHAFFQEDIPLWRLAVAPATPPLPISGEWLMEWDGGQRWLKTAMQAGIVREIAARHGGHATLFRGGDRAGQVFHPLPPAMAGIHKRLKLAFDPHGIFNRGRLYPDL
ncbi:MAG TPA: glycolate oxidase subunit GlcE [Gammaproteobacteria bacterium]|nr:glycolate oxidase subunit GlcE [Gammaproteobacteria bacterium]